ncbi:pyridoxal phosphate-dependent aminotransferase [Myceligenerans crystallogenes]|uniref:Aminotransferase n=1 Tax=Myceligenerans crystallogenes TaxID=316335 RepID=A0ABN2N9U4_9MICO
MTATEARPVEVSPTLTADAALDARRRQGLPVLSLTSGEIGLPVLPLLRRALADAAPENGYGPVAGAVALRTAAAGYWERRGLPTDPGLVVCGPGSKPLLFALVLAIGGDVVVPVPSWVSYRQHAILAGGEPIAVPAPPGEGGVPDPAELRAAVLRARSRGRDPRTVIVTVPDNPTGTVAGPETVRALAEVCRDLGLVIVSDEIYGDLVYDERARASSPARFAPERTVVTTGLAKNLALGGWRIGVCRLPAGPLGRRLHERLVAIASQLWSATAAPVQAAAACAFREPPEVVGRLRAARRLHETVARAAAERFRAAGVPVPPVRATCYLYPDLEPLRGRLAAVHGVRDGAGLAGLLVERHGIGVLPGSLFGEAAGSLTVRVSTSRLYGQAEAERNAALSADLPLRLPWIGRALDHLATALHDLTT